MGAHTFHVVCRVCRHETLTESRVEARRTARSHADVTGHDTDFGRIR